MKRRAGTVAALMLLLTFAVGGLAGMAMEEGLGLDWFDFLDEDSRPAEDQLLTNLNLSAQQRDQIEDVLDKQDERLEDYWESRIPDMRTIVGQSYEEIRLILSEEQRGVFDERIRA